MPRVPVSTRTAADVALAGVNELAGVSERKDGGPRSSRGHPLTPVAGVMPGEGLHISGKGHGDGGSSGGSSDSVHAAPPTIKTPAPALQAYLDALQKELLECKEGELATYIPELGRVEPDEFGLCMVTLDGVVYEAGTRDRRFTIQSVSKVFALALALEDRGEEYVLERVGVEPTGEAFNALSVDAAGHPKNPLINAGAIAVSCMVAGDTPEAKFEGMLKRFSQFAGRPLDMSESVYRSESTTGWRNRGYAHLLKQAGVIDPGFDVNELVEVYFKQCSILVDVHDLVRGGARLCIAACVLRCHPTLRAHCGVVPAVVCFRNDQAIMAATLANAGVNPITNRRVVSGAVVHKVLGVASTCGMYDSSGAWLFKVGIPAKSGVGGGIMCVLPGQIAMASYSPRLDHIGHSVRGVKAIQRIANDFRLHFLSVARAARSVLRAILDLTMAHSRRERPVVETRVIQKHGGRYLVLLLQGDLSFAPIERVLRQVGTAAARRAVVFDLKHVSKVNMAAMQLLLGLCATTTVVLSHTGPFHEEFNKTRLRGIWGDNVKCFPHLDAALDWAEEDLLREFLPRTGATPSALAPGDHPYLVGLRDEARNALVAACHTKVYRRGDPVASVGDNSDRVFLILQGYVDVTAPSTASLALRTHHASGSTPLPVRPSMRGDMPHIPEAGDDDGLELLGVSEVDEEEGDGGDSLDDVIDEASVLLAGDEAGTSAADMEARGEGGEQRLRMRTTSIGFRPQGLSTILRIKNKLLSLRASRLASLGRGSAVGEDSLVRRGKQWELDVFACQTCTCLVLPVDALDRVCERFPEVRVHLLTHMLAHSAGTIGRLNREVAILTR